MQETDYHCDWSKIPSGCVLTIGNFDGVHAGHSEILCRARELAVQKQTSLVAMTFEPHPVAILYPDRAPGVLSPLAMKLHRLREYADDCIIVLEDNRELLSLSAEDFVDQFLMHSIRPSIIVEGDDFNFGAQRQGTVATLTQLGGKYGFEVEVVQAKKIALSTGQQIRVSSTLIRYMLESGHVADAASALLRPYRLCGKIITGRGKGRQIGYPTMNMEKPNQIIPAQGVYVGHAYLGTSQEDLMKANDALPAVFSIGQARTFGEESPLLIECHVLTGHFGDLTGHRMAMDFIDTLRGQHKFNTIADLVAQIGSDCHQARERLGLKT
jgi:riboflavin kinase / FMN adenylyltransferase